MSVNARPERSPAPVAPSNINFKLRQLALLTALAETGTLKAAAARINVSQPGATRLLRELEEMLGATLFDRVKGKMMVTPAGLVMIQRANALQSEMLEAYQATKDAESGNAGAITLGIFSSLSPRILAEALGEVEASLPKVRVNVIEAPQGLLIGALRRYELDAVAGRLSETDGHEDLRFELLYTETFCIVAGISHPLAAEGREVQAQELVSHPWILAASGTALRQRIDTYFVTKTGAYPQGTVETRSLLAHVGLIARGTHLGVLPTQVALAFAELGLLKVIRRDFDGIDGAITFITRADAPKRRAIETLRESLVDAARKLQR